MSKMISEEEEAKGIEKKVSTLPMENSAPGRLTIRQERRQDGCQGTGKVTSERSLTREVPMRLNLGLVGYQETRRNTVQPRSGSNGNNDGQCNVREGCEW